MVSTRKWMFLKWLLPIMILFAGWQLLSKKLDDVKLSFATTRSMQEKITRSENHLNETALLKKTFEELNLKKSRIYSSFFRDPNREDIYDLLLAKASENGVTLSLATTGVPQTEENYSENQVRAEISGRYQAITKFIYSIETMDRLLGVRTLSIERGNSGNIVSTLQIAIYYPLPLLPLSLKSNNSVQEALAAKIEPVAYNYVSSSNEPFGATREMKTETDAPSISPKLIRPLNLKLKGILWKVIPLAIFESGDGRTVVVKEGEPIEDYIIKKINQESVTLSANATLHVIPLFAK